MTKVEKMCENPFRAYTGMRPENEGDKTLLGGLMCLGRYPSPSVYGTSETITISIEI